MRVLVAIDDDSLAQPIIDFVAAVFSHHGTIIKLLHVIEPSSISNSATSFYGHGISREILEGRLKDASDLLNRLRKDLRSKVLPSVPVEVSVLMGKAHHVILDCAQESNSDIIVIGSNGHGNLSRLRISSVSYAVLSHAECAVTVVKPRKLKDSDTSDSPDQAMNRMLV
jgi:nucleotide-binding universal stress UspA family protein